MSTPRPPVGGVRVRLASRLVAQPVRTPWDRSGAAPNPTRLGDLADVDSPAPPPAPPPAALVRGTDGVYRPVPLEVVVAEHQRGDVTHYVTDDPTQPPPGARVGEHVVVLAGPAAGTVYRVED